MCVCTPEKRIPFCENCSTHVIQGVGKNDDAPQRAATKHLTKFGLGDEVCIKNSNITGMITAIYLRPGSQQYEFSYINNNCPTSSTVEIVEIERCGNRKLGFKN